MSETAASRSLEVLKQISSTGYLRKRLPQELVVLQGGQTNLTALAQADADLMLETLVPEVAAAAVAVATVGSAVTEVTDSVSDVAAANSAAVSMDSVAPAVVEEAFEAVAEEPVEAEQTTGDAVTDDESAPGLALVVVVNDFLNAQCFAFAVAHDQLVALRRAVLHEGLKAAECVDGEFKARLRLEVANLAVAREERDAPVDSGGCERT